MFQQKDVVLLRWWMDCWTDFLFFIRLQNFGIKPNELGKIINKYSQVLCMSKNSLLKRAVYLREGETRSEP